MEGLEEYIKVHGNHFTEELAAEVTNRKWDSSEIVMAAQKRVYYNVTGSTIGDMVYLTDMICNRPHKKQSLKRGIKEVLTWVQDYRREGSAFCIWLTVASVQEESFDLTPYI